MGFFFDEPKTYDVVKLAEGWFSCDQVVLEDVPIDEAEDYIDRRSGWFFDDGYDYKIVSHGL